ncbi:MAG: alpha/beta fold hydrolase [Acidobacteria bacterium]|nr:alpha/beta fold hydrolase [Acidobacteriota bacterium]
MRNLAVELASAGCHVLRFDYSGTGDSSGEAADAGVEEWVEDVELAAEELREMAAVPSVALLGVRFGAALSYLASRDRREVEGLVLWDPVKNGRRYLDESSAVQEGWVRQRPQLRRPFRRHGGDQILGFPVTPRLRRAIEMTNLPDATGKPPAALSVVVSRGAETAEAWVEQLRAAGVRARQVATDDESTWLDPGQVHMTWLPSPRTLRRVVEAVHGVRS